MKKFFFILFILFSVGLGMWAGYFYASIESNLEDILLQSVLLLLVIFIFFFIHIIVHELGHLLAGKLTGYQFLFFRIMNWAIVKEQGKVRMVRFSIAGTAGQCLMVPPENVKSMSYKPYLWGGALANFSAAMIGLVLNVIIFDSLYLYTFSIVGFMTGIMNIYPFSYNDGSSIKNLNEDPVKRQQFFQQLELSGAFTSGKEYENINPNELIVNPNEPITEQYNIYVMLIKINRELEVDNFGHALEMLEPLWQQRTDVIKPYQIEIMREYLFCHLTLELHETTIQDEILTDKVFKECLKTKQLESYRIQAAISYYVKEDLKEAEKWISKAEQSLNQAPTYADKALNTKLLNFISQKIEQKNGLRSSESSLE